MNHRTRFQFSFLFAALFAAPLCAQPSHEEPPTVHFHAEPISKTASNTWPSTTGETTASPIVTPPVWIRGMTISCQTWGAEWGRPELDDELRELKQLGVNWISIHPYAWISKDGAVRWRELDPNQPPNWLTYPIEAAHRHGLSILIKPHLGYWGSPFSWRGEIEFPEPSEQERFFRTYQSWIATVAQITRDCDGFVVGTELDRLIVHEESWRAIITAVRNVTPAPLTYAANWTDYQRVNFWSELDAIGIQAYFPLCTTDDPTHAELREGWNRIADDLRGFHRQHGKPLVFTELGYDVSPNAAREPWRSGRGASGDVNQSRLLQRRCLEVALEVMDREREWLRGAFLWKWFVGNPGRADFLMDSPSVRQVLEQSWQSP